MVVTRLLVHGCLAVQYFRLPCLLQAAATFAEGKLHHLYSEGWQRCSHAHSTTQHHTMEFCREPQTPPHLLQPLLNATAN